VRWDSADLMLWKNVQQSIAEVSTQANRNTQLHITEPSTLQNLCGAPHKFWNLMT